MECIVITELLLRHTWAQMLRVELWDTLSIWLDWDVAEPVTAVTAYVCSWSRWASHATLKGGSSGDMELFGGFVKVLRWPECWSQQRKPTPLFLLSTLSARLAEHFLPLSPKLTANFRQRPSAEPIKWLEGKWQAVNRITYKNCLTWFRHWLRISPS